jgi:hypothetical protein
MSPDSQEQYGSICLSAFRLAVKHGLKELAESLLQKLSEMSSILRQCHYEGIEYKKWVSGFFYVLGEQPPNNGLERVTDGQSNRGPEGYVRSLQQPKKRTSSDYRTGELNC